MKQPERVAELLAELRALTENDFERHRIDVLEQDLPEPPTPEIIDDKHQRFNETVYHKNTHGHYDCAAGIHRAVWTYYNGEIPNGYEIHHIDENKNNNAISNLWLLTKTEHRQIHNQNKKIFTCKFCGEKYLGHDRGNNCFCSKKCQREFNESASKYKEIRTCCVCGQTFLTDKYKPFQTCSAHCRAQLAWQKRKAKPLYKKTCAYCGNSFETRSEKAQCCSRSCTARLYYKRNKT